ncbi:MAG: hypothetical protein LBI57_03500 [Helicobacteraceae bacterium]|jgi:hypothetical protein|nr:hypothetical protein [Helicobacteraceae bacterium]
MGKIRLKPNLFVLLATAFVSAAVFSFCAYDAIGAQYYGNGKDKGYFFEFKSLPELELKDGVYQIVARANSLYSLTKRGLLEFKLYKFKTADKFPDGVSVSVYVDGAPIVERLINPYDNAAAAYIEDGVADITTIAFDMPDNAKKLEIKFSSNENTDLDILKPHRLKVHKVNFVGAAAAAIALIGFIVSCALAFGRVVRGRLSAKLITKTRDYFDDEKTALLIYRASIAILLIATSYFIMISADFTFNQEDRFHLPMSLDDLFLYHELRSDGRFFPLANTDYNLLRFLPYGYSAQGFYFINLITFITAILALVYLVGLSDKDKIVSRYINAFFIIAILLSMNRSIRAFMEIIYPERALAVTILFFMIFYKKALDGDKLPWYAVALLAAIYATYQKEPMFGVFIAVAVFSLLFSPKTKNAVAFNIALIINGAVFLAIYYFAAFKPADSFYDKDSRELSQYAIFFLRSWLVIILFAFGVVRAWFLIVKRDRASLFYDAALFASCAFACAYLALGFVKVPRAFYYFAPIAFMFAPTLIYWAKYLYFNKRRALFWTITIVLALSCRTFDLTSAIASRRNNGDFAIALSAYAKLDKRIILVVEDKQLNWTAGNLLALVTYLNGKTYTLDSIAGRVNIETRSPNDPIDYNAVYILEEGAANARYEGFRTILRGKSSTSNFAAGIYER